MTSPDSTALPFGLSRHLPILALAVAPALGVLVLRVALPGKGPASASASSTSGIDEALILPAEARWTPAQQELRSIMTQEAAKGFESSPVLTRRREVIETAPPTPDMPPPIEGPETVVPPNATLTSVMAAGEHSIAVIDGKVRRVGESVAPGWKISAIDRNAGTATLTHTTGTTHTLTLRSRQGP